jgi:sodium-dependent phosphate cotransporter
MTLRSQFRTLSHRQFGDHLWFVFLCKGANVGTTCTALIAASAEGKIAGLQIALSHLLFNLFGIALWYPIPYLRNVPLELARALGYQVRKR